MVEATQAKLNLSAICHVGAGTAGGEMFRRYWLAISRAEDLRDIPLAVKLLGKNWRSSAMAPAASVLWDFIAPTAAHHWNTATSRSAGSDALIMDGFTMSRETVWSNRLSPKAAPSGKAPELSS